MRRSNASAGSISGPTVVAGAGVSALSTATFRATAMRRNQAASPNSALSVATSPAAIRNRRMRSERSRT